MAQLTAAPDKAFQLLPRNALRPSWSYEIVTAKVQWDTGGIVTSNILDGPRTRRRPHRLKEGTDSVAVVDNQAPQTTTAADLNNIQMDAVAVPDAIQGKLPVETAQDNDVVSTMRKGEQDPELREGFPHTVKTLSRGAIRGQQLQPAFSTVEIVRGLQTGTSNITKATSKMSQGKESDGKRPKGCTVLAPKHIQDVNSISERSLLDNDFAAVPYSRTPNNLLTTNGSLPHGFERLLNSSTRGSLESLRTRHPRRRTLNDVSVIDLSQHSDHMVNSVRDSLNILVPHRSVLNNELTPLLPENDVSSTLPIFCEICIKHLKAQ